ncbi:hypothetical protein [Massilia sp. H6]|uniref:hypothetical protein n=1 Tax=Massilia sp. H6 TaxID=2970464 RepID=UPI002169AFAA|nr:hypothetical protein [Massilia sp. H6]UVW27544.1 hypothetical protein NRS07_13425 [Massilia sp. H6]
MLVVLTITLSFGCFELLRRAGVLRVLFGLAPARAAHMSARPVSAVPGEVPVG